MKSMLILTRVLIDLCNSPILGEAEHAQAVIPMGTADQQLRVMSEHNHSMVDLVVRIERASY